MMTLKIEKALSDWGTTLRLIGRFQSEHIETLKELIEESRGRVALDLGEVTLIDVDAVRFLAASKSAGIELAHCPPYIREWIIRERLMSSNS